WEESAGPLRPMGRGDAHALLQAFGWICGSSGIDGRRFEYWDCAGGAARVGNVYFGGAGGWDGGGVGAAAWAGRSALLCYARQRSPQGRAEGFGTYGNARALFLLAAAGDAFSSCRFPTGIDYGVVSQSTAAHTGLEARVGLDQCDQLGNGSTGAGERPGLREDERREPLLRGS